MLGVSRQALHLRLIGQVVMTVVPVVFGREGPLFGAAGPGHTVTLLTRPRGRTHHHADATTPTKWSHHTGGQVVVPSSWRATLRRSQGGPNLPVV